jgi:type VI protein secretion system component Hcp
MASDVFLKVDGIKSELTRFHRDEIELHGWVGAPKFSSSRRRRDGGRQAKFTDLVVAKHVDKASPSY